jgi:nucleoside-diphosphate-sugar epimerase
LSLAGKRILVTGGTGFIGGRLAERLSFEEQAHVRVLVRDWRRATWVARADVELFSGDITDYASVQQAMSGCDVVYHCAAVGAAWEPSINTNVEGTRNVLCAAFASRVDRVVYVSTIAVYGPNPQDNCNESLAFHLTGDPYNYSKIKAEELVWDFHRRCGLAVVVVRPTFVWGPRSYLFTYWPIREMEQGRWRLIDGGQGTCDAVYIDNLVDALLLAGERPEAIGKAFNITDGQPCTWSEFFSHYADMLGGIRLPSISSRFYTSSAISCLNGLLDLALIRVAHTPSREPARALVRILRLLLRRICQNLKLHITGLSPILILYYAHKGYYSVTKARQILGYEPRVSLTEGMRQTEVWLRDQHII